MSLEIIALIYWGVAERAAWEAWVTGREMSWLGVTQ